jgi:hypothetical protein
MWMALSRYVSRSEHPTADNAPCTIDPQTRHHEWIVNRTDESGRSLRRES